LLAVLTEMRRAGGAAIADRIAAAASRTLQRQAEAALDQGEMERGVSLYQLALQVDPAAEGASLLARALLDRGRRALAIRRPTEAVRWGRRALSFAEADPGAHAFLADALFAARDFPAAGDEYAKALASRPEDRALLRGLTRSRARLSGRPAERPRAPAAARPAIAPAAAATPVGEAAATPSVKPAPDPARPGAPPSVALPATATASSSAAIIAAPRPAPATSAAAPPPSSPPAPSLARPPASASGEPTSQQ
jgi:tetratricopeptide (TPR) repeat protein